MERHHRDILQRNRSNLIKEICDVDTIVYELQSINLLTDYMVQEIMCKPTKIAKIRELLDILPKRGEEAFDTFYSVLVSEDIDEGAAADILKPELKEQRKEAKKQNIPFCPFNEVLESDEEALPEVWLDVDPGEVEIQQCKKSHRSIHNKFKVACENPFNDSVYPMIKPIRGYCVIINNDDFHNIKNLSNRDGADNDSSLLSDTFERLNFEVDFKQNLTAQNIRDIVKHYSKMNHTEYECFVLVIMSHGCRGHIYGTDGELVGISEITDSFKSCTSLNKKPKLFFIQACQNDHDVTPISDELKKLNISNDQTDGSGDPNILSDYFVAMSTTPGAVSWRNSMHGSWFIQAVVFVLRRYAYRVDINDIMTKVNNLVQKGGGGGRQVSLYHSSLSKRFYFFPGWSTENIHL